MPGGVKPLGCHSDGVAGHPGLQHILGNGVYAGDVSIDGCIPRIYIIVAQCVLGSRVLGMLPAKAIDIGIARQGSLAVAGAPRVYSIKQ